MTPLPLDMTCNKQTGQEGLLKMTSVSTKVHNDKEGNNVLPSEKPPSPVQVLHELVGPCSQEESNVFFCSVIVDGKPYNGQGNSKKEAKEEVATYALRAIYDVKKFGKSVSVQTQ